MSHGTETDADQSRRDPPDAGEIDWERIERSPEFRELTSKRHRFIAVATTITLGLFAVYLALATYAIDLMGTTVLGGVPIAWLAAMSMVFMTWAVTAVYLRRADRVFGPMEERVRERATARFTRDGDDGAAPATADARTAPAAAATTEGSAR
jgi:uncharacterized membrane protein (DUF485 family)